MFDMSAQSLAQLYVDLDAENHARDGVVIDVRNNNGGFVNVYATDVFARRPYLTMTPRGGRSAPARSQLGQRALERPTILVTNRHSLSDAEDFTEGYRTLRARTGRGRADGGVDHLHLERAAGGWFHRAAPPLPHFRQPRPEHGAEPRPVDVPAQRPVGESYGGRDTGARHRRSGAAPADWGSSTFRFRHLGHIFRLPTDLEAAGGDSHPNSE